MRNQALAIVCSMASIAAVSQADVTVVTQVTSGGFHGMGGGKSLQTEMISGEHSRIEHNAGKPTGLAKLAGEQHSIVLTLLDKELIEHLNVPKKTYTEQSLKELRELFKDATHNAPDSDTAAPQKEQPPTHRITRAEFNVKATGASKTINSYPCREHVLTMLLEIENLQTHEKSETRMVSTLWVTPETAAIQQARKEQSAFAQAYMKKLGMEINPGQVSEFGTAMAAALTGAGNDELAKVLKRVPAEMKKIQGYPVVTQIDWYMKDPDAAKQETSTAPEESAEIDTANGLGGALGSFAANMTKKSVNKKIKEREQANADKPMISITSEVQSVSTHAVPAAQFAVPAGYKKIEMPKDHS
jgi:hypothetical protein